MANWKKIPFVILLLLLLISCATPTPLDTTPERTYLDRSYIYRYIDDEAEVVCWVYTVRGGISCLPLSETRLESRK